MSTATISSIDEYAGQTGLTGAGPAATEAAPVLVLGLGNILLEDEGLGVRALERLAERFDIPGDVELLDGGTTGMGLLDDLSGRRCVIVLDAVRAERSPGSIVRLSGDDVPVYFSQRATPHQVGLSDVLATLTLSDEAPQEIVILGMVPRSLELTLELSATVNDRLDELVSAAHSELNRLGIELRRKAA